jgi:hypothetical protein
MSLLRRLGAAPLLVVLGVTSLPAQGYRLRIDSRIQAVSWRGLTAATIPRDQVVAQPNGGFLTPDGYAAFCGESLCNYFTSGPELRGVPWVTQADLSAWGFGISGLSLRANGRWATDLGDATGWPGTEPDFQLVEGYLEYARGGLTARAGRLFLSGRLGAYGLDGGRIGVRDVRRGVEVIGYLGWGMARGTMLPVTDPAVNPLDDFQPRNRQVAAGLEAGFTRAWLDARVEYRREVDPAVDYFVSERASASFLLRPWRQLTVSGGGDFDFSFGSVGSADAAASWIGKQYAVTAGVRRYRPFFDLWTIWGAFSPVPYTSLHASGSVTPLASLTLRARGERYRFHEAEVFTPGVSVEDRGWRLDWGATWSPVSTLVLDAGYQAEFGPGASSRGYHGRVSWDPMPQLSLAVHGARLERPLELRFNDAELTSFGASAEVIPNPHWRFGLQAIRYQESRDRPDASAIDWDQFRVAARMSFLFGTNPDRVRLPPATRPPAEP